MIEPGTKHDKDKPRYSLLPPDALRKIVDVFEYGARKYEPNNWRFVYPSSRYYDAVLRHLEAWRCGQQYDEESGLHHLAHAACSAMILLALEMQYDKLDRQCQSTKQSSSET